MSVWSQGSDNPQGPRFSISDEEWGTIGPLEETAYSLSGDPSAPGQHPPGPEFLDKGFIFLTNEFAIKKEEESVGWGCLQRAALGALSPLSGRPGKPA